MSGVTRGQLSWNGVALAAVALVGILLASGGCVAAGLAAAGPLFTAVQLVADRTVERTLAADLDTASRATAESFVRMALRVRAPERDGETVVLEATGTRVNVRAELSPVTPVMTRLSVRAEAGRLTADKRTADEIVSQVAAALAVRAVPSAVDVSSQLTAQSETLGTLRAEVARLRSRLDEEGAMKRAPLTPPAGGSGAAAPAARGVVAVSTEQAFPRSTPLTNDLTRRPGVHRDAPTIQPVSQPLASASAEEAPSLAQELIPVGLLTPVQPLTGPRSGQ